jgi:hypothetical protein
VEPTQEPEPTPHEQDQIITEPDEGIESEPDDDVTAEEAQPETYEEDVFIPEEEGQETD